MSDVNTVVISSDKQELISQISQKLVLLRSIDNIKSYSIENTKTLFNGVNTSVIPNALILHCEKNNPSVLTLIKDIKKQEIYKNIPILLINENCSRETIIEAFDSGISDCIFMPIIDYELLIRTIWCLQKNEKEQEGEFKKNLLRSLGIINTEWEVYSKEYNKTFLQSEIDQSKKYNQHACILLITPDKKYPEKKDTKEFIDTIKKSIRTNDAIAIKEDDVFYVYLQKTKLNGAYSVFERINNNLGAGSGANAGVIEVLEQSLDEIENALCSALQKASQNFNSLIVASDFYSSDIKNQNSSKDEPEIKIQTDTIRTSAAYGAFSSSNISQNKNQGVYISENDPLETKEINSGFDKNSIKLFNQTYERKLKIVVEPAFKKYEGILKQRGLDATISSYTGSRSVFSVSCDTLSASLTLDYDGVEHITVRVAVLEGEQKRISEGATMDFTSLDNQKMNGLLSGLCDKFTRILISKKLIIAD